MDEQERSVLQKMAQEPASKWKAARHAHLEAFAAAYLKMTNIPPQEAVLVEQRDGLTTRWWFERKKE